MELSMESSSTLIRKHYAFHSSQDIEISSSTIICLTSLMQVIFLLALKSYTSLHAILIRDRGR